MRHGETEWSRDHKHTSRTDLALLPGGEAAARGLGELASEVAGRADRVIDRVRASGTERALLFAHGHLLRVLAARWLEQAPEEGARY